MAARGSRMVRPRNCRRRLRSLYRRLPLGRLLAFASRRRGCSVKSFHGPQAWLICPTCGKWASKPETSCRECDRVAVAIENRTLERGAEGPLTWTSEAACQGLEIDLFFSDSKYRQAEALAICAKCPVREECLQYALEEKLAFGIFGGTTQAQRRGK